MAQNHNVIPRFVFVRQKYAADDWLNSEKRKQIGGNGLSLNVGGLRSVGQSADALVRVNGDAVEDPVLRAPVHVIEIRDAVDFRSGIGFLANIVFA